MTVSSDLKQRPVPGSLHVLFRGDSLSFELNKPDDLDGHAFIRTNLGHAQVTRNEIIDHVEADIHPLGKDWFDISMVQIESSRYMIELPLCEVGRFEAKCYFMPADSVEPVWPEGSNVVLNVKPAHVCCANIIYNAFVRQFGPNISGKGLPDASEEACVQMLDNRGYTVIPLSGTFRNFIEKLDFIVYELGCRMIQLLPIYPTPTTYGKMGRFGSPYAALSFTAVDPALAQFDSTATPLDQFIELIDAVHQRNAKLLLDIAINHTGWAAELHETHPDWLSRDENGKIEVPGAWGVQWEDLAKLDYSRKDLWRFMADVFLTWCRRGVDGFRCDAGYMIPIDAWRYIVSKVRVQYPDTIFLLEGLGGKISVMRQILNIGTFEMAYSELFQNYDRVQVETYIPSADHISRREGIMVHFAETHDNNRLASQSITYAQMRTALCALCSSNGAFGFANGVEWFAEEKIDVHHSPSLNWGASVNQVDHIRRLNLILKHHPAFHDRVDCHMIHENRGSCIALLRHHAPSGKKILVIANLDETNADTVSWPENAIAEKQYWDMLSGDAVTVDIDHAAASIRLSPGQVLCLTGAHEDLDSLEFYGSDQCSAEDVPKRIRHQLARAKAMDVYVFYHGTAHMGNFNPDSAAGQLISDPVEYCRDINPLNEESRVVHFNFPTDIRRQVMVPPDHFLLVLSENNFHARLVEDHKVLQTNDSLKKKDGMHFTLFNPVPPGSEHKFRELQMTVFSKDHSDHFNVSLMYLCRAENAGIKTSFIPSDIRMDHFLIHGTNGMGGMTRAHVSWARLDSRYDALLAGNLNREYPVDRWIMFTRCRGWIVYQGYSCEIGDDFLVSFHKDTPLSGTWTFHFPTGCGKTVRLTATVKAIFGENAVHMQFYRLPCRNRAHDLEDREPVRLILRPDIEDRNFHDTTKAYIYGEHQWPSAIRSMPDGFHFQPAADRCLTMTMDKGDFVPEPEWQYMVYRCLDAERDLDPHSDLFSPGYFSSHLMGGEFAALKAEINQDEDKIGDKEALPKPDSRPELTGSGFLEDFPSKSTGFNRFLISYLEQYIVKRDQFDTIIAGYPWFLDWGRDTLIATRGLIKAGKTETALSILKQFAAFEENGTLPNMIRGQNTANRDTSDAPLWFFTACADLAASMGNTEFVHQKNRKKTINQALMSIAENYMSGTPNGIMMDPASGLIFSPSHFTWMDTNHPAGTPRCGYPIEIQALWYAAIRFLQRIDQQEQRQKWKDLVQKIRSSIVHFFFRKESGFLADYLHAPAGQSAEQAVADDALRPNQLFAITLEAIDDENMARKILDACESLLVPGAMRSLADRPVEYPLEIQHHGQQLNDPYHPYKGIYTGDEDTSRKPAYHNGTAWTWLFPTFCEAWTKTYGPAARQSARDRLSSMVYLINQGCIGHIPEILDGDAPHHPKGCDAQAWGISEFLRVWIGLNE